MIKSILQNGSIRILFLVGIGFCIAVILKSNNIDLTAFDYTYFTYTLLAIGLYGGVYSIDLKELHNHKKTIVSAITIGVLLKSVIIGSLLYIFTSNILAFLFGIIVAQIDPISVAHLLQKNKIKRLSQSGETVLRARSSFDDPMTVLLSLYLTLPIISTLINGEVLSFSFGNYFYELMYNVIFAVAIFTIYLLSKNKIKNKNNFEIIFLIITLVMAIYFKLMLGIALVALFLRPSAERIINKSISIAFYLSTLLLGIFIINGVSLVVGFLLALFTLIAQVISSFVLASHFSRKDKIYLAFSQQNGITSIILSIIIEGFFPGTIAITAPAIFFINSMYYMLNNLADKYFLKISG